MKMKEKIANIQDIQNIHTLAKICDTVYLTPEDIIIRD
jgi:DNA-binding Xre family transcriptional regulator